MGKITANFTTEEMGLICRALSDSMNYKPNDRWSEKWALLLECKRHQVRSENEEQAKETKEEPSEEEARHNRLILYMTLMAGCCVLMGLIFCIGWLWSSFNPDVANVFKELFKNPFS